MKEDSVEIDVDLALDQLGQFGRYQLFGCCLACLVWILCASQMMAIAFLNAVPPFKCPDETLLLINKQAWNSSCDSECIRNGSQPVFQQEFGSTIASEWDLVCSREVMADFTGSIYMIGFSIGSIFVTPMSDRMGRKWSLIICSVLLLASGGISGLVPTYEAYAAIRFFGGFFYAGGAIGWLLACEMVAPSIRAYVIAPMGMSWALGYISVGGVAYLIRDWRPFVLTTSFGLFFIVFLYVWLLPESPHWLMATNQKAKTLAWFEKAAKVNKVQFNAEDCALENKDTTPVFRKKRHPLEIRKSRILIAHIVIGSILFGANTFIYYGISIFSTQLAGDRYVNFVLGGLIEIPVFICSGILLNGRLGRRGTLCLAHAIAGFALIGLIFIPQEKKSLTPLAVAVWILGKGSITLSFNTVFIYGAELFPTTLRGASLGLCNFTARMGGIVAPYVRLTSSVDPGLPAVIFGVVSLLSAALGALLPETRGQELPEDLSDMRTSRALEWITGRKTKPPPISEGEKFLNS